MTDQLVLELCAGYNGLGMAIEAALNARVAAFSEYDKAPSKILAHRYPGVPNYGDMTKIDWAELNHQNGPITVVSGGTPCQDLSHAGRRKGMTEGTRSNLWVNMREAIAIIQPEWVIWENVRGAYSACATSESDSELGYCPRCLDPNSNAGHAPNLRALGRVLGDLSDLGYDIKWRGLRAADVGAPHGRFRVFVVAHRRNTPAANSDRPGREEHGRPLTIRPQHSTPQHTGLDAGSGLADAEVRDWDAERPAPPREGHLEAGRRGRSVPPANPGGEHSGQRRLPAPDQEESRQPPAEHPGRSGTRPPADTSGPALGQHPGGTPAEETGPQGSHGPRHPDGEQPTRDGRQATAVSEGDGWGEGRPEHARLEGRHDAPLGSDTPATDAVRAGGGRRPAQPGDGEGQEPDAPAHRSTDRPDEPGPAGPAVNWGEYEPAIRRWEQIIGRRAPRPTELTGRNGGARLSARFTEWMMGLPDGWVTAPEIGITRNEQLKACGNGVVPQQAYAAIVDMVAEFEEEWARAAA